MTVLLGGDFRQILPVIPNAKRPEIIQACINQSELWKYCKVFMLTRSMHVNEYACNGEIGNRKQDFNRWVLVVGDGKLPAKKRNQRMSQHGLRFQKNSLSNHKPLQLSRLSRKRTPISLQDEICKASTNTTDQHDLYPVEFLNSLNFPGMPPPCPLLKKGTPNNAHSEYKPKSGSVQWDENSHY
ncbi:ATP-dependent DNA helicase PIF1-like protein [Tanacetum coccineum]